MTTIDYPIFDADNHYYEPDDCFTRHIEERFRKETVWIDRQETGPARMYVGEDRCNFFSVAVGDHVGPPGLMKAFLKGMTDTGFNPNVEPIDAKQIPEFVERGARLRKMDEQNVEGCLMLPTAGVGVEPQLRTQPELLYASLRAFNRWLEEDWGYGEDGRIFGAPLISLVDLDQALLELDRLAACGARFVILTAGPIDGRSPADPCFDPFWAKIQETGMKLVYHIGSTPLGAMYNVPWGLRANPPSHRHSMMEYALSFTDRPIADTLTALVSDNLFGRFPDLKILSIEYGSYWARPLLKKLDQVSKLMSKDMWRFGAPPMLPSETFARNVWITPFYEDDCVDLTKLIGVGQVLAGSDYPHPEGLESPVEFAEELVGLDEKAVRRVMRENLKDLTAI